jgi:MoCo/4Fe-4S cofactor protein with predicted Tat translocation signal
MDSLKVLSNKCDAEHGRPAEAAPLDLGAVRERLRGKKGDELWRSLDELGDTPEFREFLHREFPRQASELSLAADGADGADGGVSRRNFLKLTSASLALAGMTACTRQPVEKIVPYVEQPEQIVPGKPLFFATTSRLGGYGTGVLAESHMGRPTKIEGNPDHPASLGATDIFAQASVLTLYDPERSQSILKNGRIDKWSNFIAEIGSKVRALEALGGEGVRILTGDITSPTELGLLDTLMTRLPQARWVRWEPAGDHNTAAGSRRAFGAPYSARYDLTRARVVVALESDFLSCGSGHIRYARDFTAGRKVRKSSEPVMNRLYAVESTPTSTASLADHRLQVPPAQVEVMAALLATRLGVAGAAVPAGTPADTRLAKWADEVARDLRAAAPGSTLVAVGEGASPAAHVLGHAMNQALGNVGSTVVYTEPVARSGQTGQAEDLAALVADLNAGGVELLLLLGGVNPVYNAPADLRFTDALKKARLSIHHGMFEDETSQYCNWHVPATHDLESWGDARSFDGTVSFLQPLIEPLHESSKTTLEILGVLLNRLDVTPYDLVREQWQGKIAGDFEAGFRKILHDGLIVGSQLPPAAVPGVDGGAIATAAAEIGAVARRDAARGAIVLQLRPDPTIHDGSFANHPWLQELPKPLSKLTWDNALMLSPRTAEALKLAIEDPVEVSWKDAETGATYKLNTAVWVLPGQADGTAGLTLGYGRARAGQRGTNLGFNAYALRTTKNLWSVPGISIRSLGGRYKLACTQNHHLLESGMDEIPLAMEEAEKRHLVRVGTLEQYKADPAAIAKPGHHVEDLSFYPDWEYKGPAWGMAIDLSSCTGCSSCIVACQAENNIPAVGKEQVLRGREMHWLRIDRYYQGDLDDPGYHFQPLPCMQCERAPCEVVCPVAATSHSEEGLNDMTYNRCVGTRYCSNNCPYKVRRFNFFRFSERTNPLIALAQNPDVTVRMRGVMEKCTYCVQRIEESKIDSKVTGKPIEERRLQTACQQACPTQAIVFGDILQPDWEVSRRKAEPTNYSLLEDLNTRPRTTYLAKIKNPNPALEPATTERNEHGHA